MATVLKLTNKFADGTTRNIELGPFESLNATNVVNQIKALNSDTSEIASYYLSDGGASFTAITNAQITTEAVTEIDIED